LNRNPKSTGNGKTADASSTNGDGNSQANMSTTQSAPATHGRPAPA